MTINLFTDFPANLPDELLTTLLKAANVRIERIVSHGHVSPEGFLYDQDEQQFSNEYQFVNGVAMHTENPDEFQKRDWPIRVSMTWLYINCDLQHVNKGTAIDRLLAETGIDPKTTAGIGETMEDRFIAERVSWFGCPANADAEIKKIGFNNK